MRGLASRCLTTALVALVFVSSHSFAEGGSLEFVIPSGAGGGWDSVARSSGQALFDAGKLQDVKYTNMPGEGTLVAQRFMLEQNDTDHKRLLAHSSSIVVGKLNGADVAYDQMAPVAAVAGDYFAWFVAADSPIEDFSDVLEIAASPGRNIQVGGGGGRQSEILTARILLDSDVSLQNMDYHVLRSGKEIMQNLGSGTVDVIAYGVSIGLPLVKSGKLRMIAYSAPTPVAELDFVTTLKQQDVDFEFVNYRLFYAAPSEEGIATLAGQLEEMTELDVWKEVVSSNGWIDVFLGPGELEAALSDQEELMAPAVTALSAVSAAGKSQ